MKEGIRSSHEKSEVSKQIQPDAKERALQLIYTCASTSPANQENLLIIANIAAKALERPDLAVGVFRTTPLDITAVFERTGQ